MDRRDFLLMSAIGSLSVFSGRLRVGALAPSTATAAGEGKLPNIVYIICDDLGYGDVSVLNPERGKIPTPHIDSLARQGMVFTDTHSGSAVCSPTRYGVLTGRYAWRTRLQEGVVDTADADPLIAEGRLTVGSLLQSQGYHTGIVGKWHLGMHLTHPTETLEENGPFPVGTAITEGPLTRGFDYFFGFEHARSMRALMENGRVIADIDAVEMLPAITEKAVGYVNERGPLAKQGQPFFLYLPFNSPHTPIAPTEEWKGKSSLGHEYADFVMQTDAAVGEVLQALEEQGLTDDTLVIFTSDNGCAHYIGAAEMEAKGHFPSAQFRGYKGDIWDGGHRIPFIVRWPGKVKAGSRAAQLGCLTDLLATCAEIAGAELPSGAAEDSVSILPALLGTAEEPLREAVVHHSSKGYFSIRKDNWKLSLCADSGGFTNQPADRPAMQLYDLSVDIGETENLTARRPEVVRELVALLEKYVREGRSTPGVRQANDVPVDIFKPDIAAA